MSEFSALIDFSCLEDDCRQSVSFNIFDIKGSQSLVQCAHCRRQYTFGEGAFLDKLQRFSRLMVAVREADDLLGDVSVGVTTLNGQVKVPYRMLLSRMNATITLDMGGRKVDFHYRVEPGKSTQLH